MSECKVLSSKLSSYGLIARVVLEEKGVPYKHEIVEMDAIKAPDYLQRHHPFGMMPAFHHGDFHLFETAAIARYIDEAFEGPSLQPGDPKSRAQMQKWISILDNYMYPAIIRDLVLQRLAPILQDMDADERVVAAAAQRIETQLALLDAALKDRDFLVGDFSLADVFVASVVQYIDLTPEGRALMTGTSNVAKWVDDVTGRESYEKASYTLEL